MFTQGELCSQRYHGHRLVATLTWPTQYSEHQTPPKLFLNPHQPVPAARQRPEKNYGSEVRGKYLIVSRPNYQPDKELWLLYYL